MLNRENVQNDDGYDDEQKLINPESKLPAEAKSQITPLEIKNAGASSNVCDKYWYLCSLLLLGIAGVAIYQICAKSLGIYAEDG